MSGGTVAPKPSKGFKYLSADQKKKILHAFKALILARRQFTDYMDEICDDLAKDLKIISKDKKKEGNV